MKTIASATLLAVTGEEGEIKVDPSAIEVAQAKSVHVLGFTPNEELLVVESEGSFSPDEWSKILQAGQQICCQQQGEDTTMSDGALESASIQDFIRSVMKTKIAADLYWK